MSRYDHHHYHHANRLQEELQHQELHQHQHQQQQTCSSSNVAPTEGRNWSLNCHFNHTLILMNCKSRAEAFARHLQTKLKSLGRLSVEGDYEGDDSNNDDYCPNDDDRGRCPSAPSSSPAMPSMLSLSATAHHAKLLAAEKSHLIGNQKHEPAKLTSSSFGEDELYFDFDYSSPESPVHELEQHEHDEICHQVCFQPTVDEIVPSLSSWQPESDVPVTQQPHSINTTTECERCTEATIGVTQPTKFDEESGCISAVSSVFTDHEDDYTTELDDDEDDGEVDELLSIVVLDEDFGNTVLTWPLTTITTNPSNLGFPIPDLSELPASNQVDLLAHRLTPITEQLTLEEVENELVKSVGSHRQSNPDSDVDVTSQGQVKDPVCNVIDSQGQNNDVNMHVHDKDLICQGHTSDFDNNNTVPFITTSAHSPVDGNIDVTISSVILPKDFNRLHVDVDIAGSNFMTEESELLSPTSYEDGLHSVRVRRSSSLKTCKTPPGTPNRKKIVRFADALGLDLEAVKTVFLDDLPTVPSSAYNDLQTGDLLVDDVPYVGTLTATTCSRFGWPRTTMVAQFQQPGTTVDFLDRVRRQSVCLESAVDVTGPQLVLIVRVVNLDYNKVVVVRYTSNEWLTHDEVVANYVPGSSDGFTDRFQLTLNVNHVQAERRLLFAVRYTVGGSRCFWDNNDGNNYVFKCVVDQGDCHPVAAAPAIDESWIHFL